MGNPAATVGGNVQVGGARQGIDGTYRIDGVEHRFSRPDGFQTILTVGQPGAGAGSGGGDYDFDPNAHATPGYTGGGPTSGPPISEGYTGGGPTGGP